jgi:uncharacterized protein
MKTVFVDTWAWYALTDKADSDHEWAELTNEELLDKGYTFVTTNFVLGEAVTMIRYKMYHGAAVRFWQMVQRLVDAGLVQLVRVDETHETAAWAIFEKYTDQKFSYVDCTSFAVMHILKLQEVFTADNHFAILGFTRVP